MIRISLTSFIIVLTTIKVVAQTLNIGDKVPDFHIGKIINYPKESIQFSDIKARLVILDYWTNGCASCIEAMPRMDALQKKFGDKIFILAANHQPTDVATSFWMKNNYLKSTSLPTVVGDTILEKYTPWHGGAGLHVWILDGKIFAYPSSAHATEKNISDVLAGVPKKWNLAITARKYFDFSKSILDGDTVSLNKSDSFFSVITPYNPSFREASYNNLADSTRTSTRIVSINSTAFQLYRMAVQHLIGDKSYKIKNKLYDESIAFRYGNTDDDEWIRANTYCYEAVLPGKLTKQQLGEYMLSDLNKLLALNGRIEKQKEEYLVLSLKPGIRRIKDNINKGYLEASGEEENVKSKFPYPSPEFEAFKESAKGQELNRWRLVKATWMLSDIISSQLSDGKIEVIDKTNYDSPFEITMPIPYGKKMTFSELQNIVSKYGFELKKGGFHEVNVFVLKRS